MGTMNMKMLRVGNFTSSEIFKLLTKGKATGSMGAPALTLIEECNVERRLLRSISADVDAKATTWGMICEKYLFEKMGTEYTLYSDQTIQHPTIPYWVGSPEGNKFDEGKTVYDIKCPWTLKSFCEFIDSGNIEAIRLNHKAGEQYYWQLISNAILTESKYAELKIFVPYLKELEGIREVVQNWDGDQNAFAWINWAHNDKLPWIHEGGHYKNLNTFRFEVPQADKDKLTEAVKRAGDMLVFFSEIKEEEKKVMQPNPQA